MTLKNSHFWWPLIQANPFNNVQIGSTQKFRCPPSFINKTKNQNTLKKKYNSFNSFWSFPASPLSAKGPSLSYFFPLPVYLLFCRQVAKIWRFRFRTPMFGRWITLQQLRSQSQTHIHARATESEIVGAAGREAAAWLIGGDKSHLSHRFTGYGKHSLQGCSVVWWKHSENYPHSSR